VATGVLTLFAALVALGALEGYAKVSIVALVGCGAMCAGALIGSRDVAGGSLWQALDGIAGGAMVAAACVLLLPAAMTLDPVYAGVGVALGLLAGMALHQVCRREARARSAWREFSLIALTVHSAGAGVVIGMLYARMPELGLWLGTVVVAHKLPAGYAVARRLRKQRVAAVAPVLLPACAVGIAAIPTALATDVLPESAMIGALCQGLATGLFLHVGIECVGLDHPAEADVRDAGWRSWAAVMTGVLLMLALRVAGGG